MFTLSIIALIEHYPATDALVWSNSLVISFYLYQYIQDEDYRRFLVNQWDDFRRNPPDLSELEPDDGDELDPDQMRDFHEHLKDKWEPDKDREKASEEALRALEKSLQPDPENTSETRDRFNEIIKSMKKQLDDILILGPRFYLGTAEISVVKTILKMLTFLEMSTANPIREREDDEDESE